MGTKTPQEFVVSRLLDPTEDEVDRLIQMVMRGFRDDPFRVATCGGDTTLLPDFFGSYIRAALVAGHVFVAYSTGNPECIVGCATFYGPGKILLGDEEQLAQGFNSFMKKLPEDLVRWWMKDFFPSYTAAVDQFLGPGAKLKYWCMHNLAVDPDYRRRGIARALVGCGERLAREDGLPMVLETGPPENVEVCQHLGYTLVGVGPIDMGAYSDTLFLKIFRKDFVREDIGHRASYETWNVSVVNW